MRSAGAAARRCCGHSQRRALATDTGRRKDQRRRRRRDAPSGDRALRPAAGGAAGRQRGVLDMAGTVDALRQCSRALRSSGRRPQQQQQHVELHGAAAVRRIAQQP
jgi:hypothetical protein